MNSQRRSQYAIHHDEGESDARKSVLGSVSVEFTRRTFGTIRERQFRAIAEIGSSAGGLDELFCQPEFVKKGEVLCEFPCE